MNFSLLTHRGTFKIKRFEVLHIKTHVRKIYC